MAYTRVQHAFKVSTDTNAITTTAANFTGADILIALVGYFDGVNPPGNVTDSVGSNTWVPLTAKLASGSTQWGQLWYVKNANVSSSMTFSFGAAVTYPCIFVEGWSGSHLTAPFDQESGSSDTSGNTTNAPGSLTPSENNCLLIAGVIYPQADVSDVASVDSSFTLGDHNTSGIASNIGGGLAYEAQTTATARNPTFTAGTGSPRSAAVMAVFKAAAAGGGGVDLRVGFSPAARLQ